MLLRFSPDCGILRVTNFALLISERGQTMRKDICSLGIIFFVVLGSAFVALPVVDLGIVQPCFAAETGVKKYKNLHTLEDDYEDGRITKAFYKAEKQRLTEERDMKLRHSEHEYKEGDISEEQHEEEEEAIHDEYD
jgi:hypothetical protein